jgi:glycolate oxidase FAD binding subunit
VNDREPVSDALAAFVDDVGTDDPVAVEGGRTAWSVGGAVAAGTRLVRAPVGVVAHHPAEMTVRVGAGTTRRELDDVLRPHGQTTVLDGPAEATVGGILAVGGNGIRRLRVGPVRDALLEARYVSAEGRLITAGGPTVKNVTGYDLCRLLVGSLGTLGFLGEVILRTRPRPAA